MAPDSPCVNICVIDEASGFCIGCGRTIAEITAWIGMTPAERASVRTGLAGRLADIEEAKHPCGSASPSR